MPDWPEWWEWDLDLIDHVEKRMKVRRFTEVELRDMIEQATGLHKARVPGRWVIETKFDGRAWNVVVEPIAETQTLEVVTAFRVKR